MHVWQSKSHWDPLGPTDWPGEGSTAIRVAAMRGEYRSAALNVSNATGQPAALRLSVAGLPVAAESNLVTVHDVPFTDTKSWVPVAAALPVARRDGGTWQIDVPAGMTRQVWLTFHGPGVPAGTYRGRIQIAPAGIEVPVTPGKHMEAIREGVEDYETLRMLRDRVEQLSSSGVASADLAAARKLFATAEERVTAVMDHPTKINWHEDKDRTVADQVRIEVLEMLVRISTPD